MISSLSLWATSSGLGAFALAALAVLAERTLGPRRSDVATGLWWASLLRLVLPPDVGSPVGWSIEVAAVPESGGTILIAAWILGWATTTLVATGRVLRERRTWSRRRTRAATPETEALAQRCARAIGLRRPPRVAAVEGVGAACIGIFTPWIAIPRELERAERRRDLEVVLLHECAHAKRRDGALRAAVLALQCAFWFHPAAWLAGRRLAALAEIDCDRRAAAAVRGGVESYRSTLLAQARGWLERDGLIARPFTHPRSLLLARLRALDEPLRPRNPLAAGLALLCALACIGPAVRSLAPPKIDHLEGCLQTRYAVHAWIANENARASQE
ncbi:MAG: M56 family metallopeptidase [Planctomycetota bacterium]